MMLHKGGKILSKASVEMMTSDQLTPENRIGSELFFGGYRSWGLGMAVDIGRKEIYHSPGRYGWEGGLGTAAYIDPANEMICILFTQRMMESPVWPRAYSDFYTLAYAAME
jgi:CubicO group peptidase (beta-lactamase class C family)